MNPPFEYDFDSDFDDEEGDDIEKEKSKMLMDFGLDKNKPEKVTIEVLQRFIKDNPDKMYQAARQWLHFRNPKG